MYKIFIKRIVDFLVSFFGLIVISPIFLIVFILLIIANNGKPFFFQLRPGKHGELFNIVKFKTMNDKKDKNGDFLPFNERITGVGNILRKTSLDEIPQLLNVLIGNMSLVGPRPLLPEYLPLYSKEQKIRHDVKPGITGWAQVNGRNTISWKKKFEYDVWYVNNISPLFDLKIIFMTIKKVLKKDDINSRKDSSMEVFTGNK